MAHCTGSARALCIAVDVNAVAITISMTIVRKTYSMTVNSHLAYDSLTMVELHRDDRAAPETGVIRPGVANLTGRTGHLMRVPINLKVGHIEGLLVLSLPAHVGTQGGKEIHAVFGLAAS